MNGSQALITALGGTKVIFQMYLKDLSDADLLIRPVEGANHIAWQIGHLINTETSLAGGQLPGVNYPALPDGFKEAHSMEANRKETPEGFLSRVEYLRLFEAVRSATLEAVSKLTDADLDRPNTGPMADFAPTLGALLVLISNHTLMHAGQFSVVRRKLGKPVAM